MDEHSALNGLLMPRRMFFCAMASLVAIRSPYAQPITSILIPIPGAWQVPHPLANCEVLAREVEGMKRQLVAVRSNTSVAESYMNNALIHREPLKKALQQAKKADQEANLKVLFATVNLAAGVTFLAFGLAFSVPLAVGLAVSIQIIGVTSVLGWQLMKLPNEGGTAVAGYTRDRALFMAELAGAEAGSTPGKIISKSVQGISLLLAAWEFNEAQKDADSAKAKLALALSDFDYVEKRYAVLGTNRAAWANMLENSLQGTIDRLERFISASRDSDCIITGPTIGPR